jgi:hypothetical protein
MDLGHIQQAGLSTIDIGPENRSQHLMMSPILKAASVLNIVRSRIVACHSDVAQYATDDRLLPQIRALLPTRSVTQFGAPLRPVITNGDLP